MPAEVISTEAGITADVANQPKVRSPGIIPELLFICLINRATAPCELHLLNTAAPDQRISSRTMVSGLTIANASLILGNNR